MTTPEHYDGNLLAARVRLANAISALIDPKPHLIHLDGGHTRTVYLDGLYVQLVDAISAARGGGVGGALASRLPIWAAGLDLVIEIDAQVARWQPTYLADPREQSTTLRLRALDERSWRPQDVTQMEEMSDALIGWAKRIDAYFAAKPLELTEKCPRCHHDWAYYFREGEWLRQRALQVTVEMAACGNCHARWTPDQFEFLGKVLQCARPEGVVG